MITSNTAKQFAFSLTLIGAIAFTSTALADSGASDYESAQQINAANELLRKGEIDQAIEGYGNVANSEANRDELKYNMAVAQYRKSDIPAATSLFAETAGSSDASIAALSRFNLGNCLYATALQTAEQDKPAAIELLRTAISHFRGSLRGMPDNEDARANIELAAELIRKLEDEQKQEEEQQQDQQQQDQQQQDQEQQDQEQNQDQQNQDEQQQNQDEQNRDSQDSQSQGSKSDQSQQDDQQKEQSDESKSDESKSDEQRKNESEQSDSQNKSDESQQQQSQDAAEQEQSESTSQPNSEQSQAEKPQQTQNRQSRNDAQQSREDEASLDEQPQDNQPVPTGELTAADEQDDNKEPNGSVAMADPNAKDDGLMTKEEALKMLQAVRDRDMLRRLRQQQRERSRNVRVDRDW